MNTQEYKSLQCVAGGFNDIQLERPDENYENGSLLPFLVHDWRKEKECQVSWSDNDDDGDVGGTMVLLMVMLMVMVMVLLMVIFTLMVMMMVTVGRKE